MKLRVPAPTGGRYAAGAFDRVVGSKIEIRGLGFPVPGEVVSVEVEPGGAAAILELSFADLEALQALRRKAQP